MSLLNTSSGNCLYYAVNLGCFTWVVMIKLHNGHSWWCVHIFLPSLKATKHWFSVCELSSSLPSLKLSHSLSPLSKAHPLTAISSAKAFFRKLHEYYRLALMNGGVCNLHTHCFSSSAPSIMGSYVARPFSTQVHSKFADREMHGYVNNEFHA